MKSTLPIIKASEGKKLDKGAMLFNSRIRKINQLKKEIAEAKAIIQQIGKLEQEKVRPLLQEMAQARAEFVRALHQYYPLKFFRKREKSKISYLILNEIDDLIDDFGFQEFVALREFYEKERGIEVMSDEEAAADAKEAKEMFKALLERMTGLDLEGFEDLEHPEEIKDFVRKKIDEARWAKEQQAAQRKRKISKAEEKRQAKKEAEARQLSKTTRSLYTELVKFFHPDREPNEKRRLEKTEVMKKITEAYNQDDYFELMRLQIQYLDKISQDNIHELPEAKLKYYNKILLDQKKELEGELMQLTNPYSPHSRLVKACQHDTNFMTSYFRERQVKVSKEIAQIRDTTQDLLMDKAHLRNYLKDIEEEEEDEGLVFVNF
ncbi:MAG: hypothetical protein HC913_06060 [Microscillaceae bacterium]|nr:hypothetical protein [Microscillaceae bacterium]